MRPLLITAGATRNPIDAIRYLSAGSTGRTGVALAEAAAPGVHLLASEEAALRVRSTPGLSVEIYGSTRDLMARMRGWVMSNPDGVLVHAAAVGDYELEGASLDGAAVSAGKIPSGHAQLTLSLRPAPKILDQLRAFGLRGPLVSFKAAAPGTSEVELRAIADAQRQRSGSDLVFANVIGALDELVLLVDAAGVEALTDRGAALRALGARLQAWRAPR